MISGHKVIKHNIVTRVSETPPVPPTHNEDMLLFNTPTGSMGVHLVTSLGWLASRQTGNHKALI